MMRYFGAQFSEQPGYPDYRIPDYQGNSIILVRRGDVTPQAHKLRS